MPSLTEVSLYSLKVIASNRSPLDEVHYLLALCFTYHGDSLFRSFQKMSRT